MGYTDLKDLEDLEEQQDADGQLRGDTGEAEDRQASEQLLRHKRLWESTTPEGSPTRSGRGRSREVEEPLVFMDRGANDVGGTRIEEWTRYAQSGESPSPTPSSHTITRESGMNRGRAMSTPNREEGKGQNKDWEGMQDRIREEITLLETRMTNLAGRAHKELKEAVGAGLTVIQTEV